MVKKCNFPFPILPDLATFLINKKKFGIQSVSELPFNSILQFNKYTRGDEVHFLLIIIWIISCIPDV